MFFVQKSRKINLVFFLLIFNSIWSIFYVKDAWAGYNAEVQIGWQYQLSKVIYAIVILIMFPVVYSHKRFFGNARILASIIILYVLFSYAFNVTYDFSNVSKFFLLSLSFPFFANTLECNFNKSLLKVLIISITLNITNSILQANTLATSIQNDSYGTGQGTAANIIYLLPIIFYTFRGKISSFFYLFGFVLIVISLRRTAILAYLLCTPFIFERIKHSVSKKNMLFVITILVLLLLYFINNYRDVLELRFLDMFEADEQGNYGSGRSDWFALLFRSYTEKPAYWLWGFGPQKVGWVLHGAGYPFNVAHSDVLELLLGYGIVGTFLWYYTFYKMYKIGSSHRVQSEDRMLIYMSILSYVFMSTISGALFNPNFIVIPIFYGLILNKKV